MAWRKTAKESARTDKVRQRPARTPVKHPGSRELRGQRCQPFTWTKDADQILTKVNGGNTTATSDHHEVVSPP